MTAHPTAELLALFSNADLPWLDRRRIRRHLAHCEECHHQVALFRASKIELQRQAACETLTGFEAVADWPRLEREMEGNIVVGLAAARCIEGAPKHRVLLTRFALVFGLLLLFVLGWMTHVSSVQSGRIFAALRGAFAARQAHDIAEPILRTQPDGIVVGSSQGSLTILHPASAVVTLSGTSSVEARYVDDETGQVTITNVYGE